MLLTAEVCAVANTRDAVCDLVHHVVTGVWVVLLDELVAGWALLRAAVHLPGLQRVVHVVLHKNRKMCISDMIKHTSFFVRKLVRNAYKIDDVT